MNSKSKIIIVRHGQSTSNVLGHTTGWQDAELSELGMQQAELLGQALKDEKIDIIISSDLKRAKQTTEAIAKFHSTETRFVEALRERSYGVLNGKPGEQYDKALSESGKNFQSFRPEDGESLESLLIRASNFWRFWAPQAKNNTLLLSGHGTFSKMLIMFLTGKTFEDWQSLKQSNACINTLCKNEKGVYQIEKLNDTSHLSSLKSST